VAPCSWQIAVSVLEEHASCILILVAATLLASFYLHVELLTSHCRKHRLNALWVDLTCWNGGGVACLAVVTECALTEISFPHQVLLYHYNAQRMQIAHLTVLLQHKNGMHRNATS